MDLCITADSVFVGGYVYEFSNEPNSEKFGTEKAFVAKLSLNGEVEYIKRLEKMSESILWFVIRKAKFKN